MSFLGPLRAPVRVGLVYLGFDVVYEPIRFACPSPVLCPVHVNQFDRSALVFDILCEAIGFAEASSPKKRRVSVCAVMVCVLSVGPCGRVTVRLQSPV